MNPNPITALHKQRESESELKALIDAQIKKVKSMPLSSPDYEQSRIHLSNLLDRYYYLNHGCYKPEEKKDDTLSKT